MIPKYYKERKKTLKKFFYYDLYRKTSTWCVLLSPFLKKGVAQFVWSASKKTTISTNISLMDAIIFIFCQQSNYYFQIYYISPVAPYDKILRAINLLKLLLADFFSFFCNLFLSLYVHLFDIWLQNLVQQANNFGAKYQRHKRNGYFKTKKRTENQQLQLLLKKRRQPYEITI